MQKLRVTVKKANNSLTTILRFQQLFGGTTISIKAARAGWQDQTAWVLNGKDASDFCREMAPYTFLKRPQMEVAATFPIGRTPLQASQEGETILFSSCEDLCKHIRATVSACSVRRYLRAGKRCINGWTIQKSARNEVAAAREAAGQKVKALKKQEHAMLMTQPPDAYCCGFFEADGCLSIRGPQQQIASIIQAHKAMPMAFQAKYGGKVYWQKLDAATLGGLWTWRKSEPSAFYSALLPFSFEKRQQMEIALSKTDWREANAKMGPLKGNQRFNHVKKQ